MGNKTSGVSRIGAAAQSERNIHIAACGEGGRTERTKERRDINFHSK